LPALANHEVIALSFAEVEPVFANPSCHKGLNRFPLRGLQKVAAQWELYCLVHKMEKLANNGYAN